MLRIGADEVWKINQADGLYTAPPVSNAAYGRTLYIRGDLGANLKTGSPKRYYKLSYLRFEVSDETGTKMATIQFPNHGGDGSGLDPDAVPVVADHLEFKIHIDNRPMSYNLGTPAINDCGVVPWADAMGPGFQFHVHAEQLHGRVHQWRLRYTRGADPTRVLLSSASYNSGQSPVDVDVSGAPLRVDPSTSSGMLESTCAFALILDAWAHIRVKHGFHYCGEKIYAIAVEKCPRLPAVVPE